MNPELSPQLRSPILLRSPNKKPMLLFGISALLVLAGLRVVATGDSVGWILVGIFGICAAVWALEMLPQAHSLQLDSDGFRIKNHFLTSRFRWSDIREFGVLQHDSIGFISGKETVYMKVNMLSFSDDGSSRQLSLPSHYGLPAGELAELLQQWKRHFSGESQ